jgi:outer membrane immunogenic protein
MKKFLLSTVAIAMLSTAASAADLDMAPEPILDNWAGWYAGINGGYGFVGDPDVPWLVSLDGDDYISERGTAWNTDASGGFGGGQVGYNWQDDIYVYGLEGDFQFSDIKGKDGYYEFDDGSSTCQQTACPISGQEQLDRVSQKLKWFSTIRGRAGVSPNESLLFYATAGLAFGQVKNKGNGYYEAFGWHCCQPPNTSYSGSSSKTKVGWTAGFGSELKITENVSFKVEYLYLDLGKTTIKSDELVSSSVGASVRPEIRDVRFRHKFKNQFHTLKAGFNWGF